MNGSMSTGVKHFKKQINLTNNKQKLYTFFFKQSLTAFKSRSVRMNLFKTWERTNWRHQLIGTVMQNQ